MRLAKSNFKKLIIATIATFYITIAFSENCTKYDVKLKVDSVYGYLNNDKNLDLITIESNEDTPPVLKLKIYFNQGDDSFILKKDKEYIAWENVYMPKFSIAKKGNIEVWEYHYRFEMIYTYKYFEQKGDWFLYSSSKEISDEGYITETERPIWPLYETRAIGEDGNEWVSIVSKQEKDSIEHALDTQYLIFSNEFKSNSYSKIFNYKIDDFYSVLRYVGINSKNVQKINDLGFFLIKAERYELAVVILNKVVRSFPERTVAYINLGDAYYGLNDTGNAKEAYQKYIKLMKANGKGNKIPGRIWSRIKE